jgi:hypothetical protein
MDLGDLIFWLFLAFAGLPRLIEWLKQRQEAQQQTSPKVPQVERQPARSEDFFEEWERDWDEGLFEPEPLSKPVAAPMPAPQQLELRPAPVLKPSFAIEAVTAAPLVTAADQGRMLRTKLGLDQRSDLQRSILLMNVLGPCRALQPYKYD